MFPADSRNDPVERTNLAGDSRYRAVRARLATLVRGAAAGIPAARVREAEFSRLRQSFGPV